MILSRQAQLGHQSGFIVGDIMTLSAVEGRHGPVAEAKVDQTTAEA